MEKILEQLIDKGFKAKTLTTIWTADSYIVSKKAFLVNNICVILLLEEIKAWFRNEHKIHICIDCNHSGWFFNIFKTNGTSIYLFFDTNDEYSETYELALQTGIEQATKLI